MAPVPKSTILVPSSSATNISPSAEDAIATVSPIVLYVPPTLGSKTHDILHAVAGVASVISMNMHIIRHGPPATVKTSLTLPRLSFTLLLTAHHSFMPDLFHLKRLFLFVDISATSSYTT